jgi:hypothetical protein
MVDPPSLDLTAGTILEASQDATPALHRHRHRNRNPTRNLSRLRDMKIRRKITITITITITMKNGKNLDSMAVPAGAEGRGEGNTHLPIPSFMPLALASLCFLPMLMAESTGTNDIRDIQPPVPITSIWDWLPWALAAVAVLLLLYALYRWWKRKPQSPPQLAIPPHVRARDRLRQALDLISQPKPFCILISDTLRIYLEQRFQWHAPERTTEEFLDELQASVTLDPDQKQSLSEFLTRCDLVKFARQTPTEPELLELLDVALRLVEQTIPAPPGPAAPNPGMTGPEPALS